MLYAAWLRGWMPPHVPPPCSVKVTEVHSRAMAEIQGKKLFDPKAASVVKMVARTDLFGAYGRMLGQYRVGMPNASSLPYATDMLPLTCSDHPLPLRRGARGAE